MYSGFAYEDGFLKRHETTMICVALVVLGLCHVSSAQLLNIFDNSALELFHAIDSDVDGKITYNEMIKEFTQEDTNNNGYETRFEFTEFICREAPEIYQMGHYLFDEIDSDSPKDHLLEAHDYAAFFKKIDTNGDGFVTQNEYTSYTVGLFFKYGLLNLQHPEHFNHGASSCH